MSLDNFAYIITDEKTTVIIDPGDPEPVCVSISVELDYLEPDCISTCLY